MFLRFEPLSMDPSAQLRSARGDEERVSGMTRYVKTANVQPSQTLILDLKKEPEKLLAAMHEKTRYNIRLAEKKGVRVYAASGKEDSFEIFWDLLQETTERDAFRSHDKTYYRTMLETLAGDPAANGKTRPVAKLAFAEHDGRVLAANLMIYFGKTVTYLHGASSRVQREVMAPYLLHWQLIREARSWGYDAYDFWGVAPENEPDHPWAGITRFKRGFGGTYVEYPGAFDLPISRFWYTLYTLARRLRK
jgi:lipid II:glycine glycyltransferase (peptidoglycan interpeptide bridge formation enzyme)